MKTTIQLSLTALIAASIVSCKNPADATTDAQVGKAQETLSGSGTKYTFTENSTIEFTGSKVTGAHSGGFKTFSGHFFLDSNDVPSAGEFTIDMDSTWSDHEKLTAHLKNEDFFNVEKYPSSEFKLSKVEKATDGSYTLSGNFTLHGVTKNISFPATAEKSDSSASIKAEFDINRKDFGIVYAGRADDLIRDEVVIRLNLQANAE